METEMTVRVTLTPGEVQQALLDWVRRNYRGDEAQHLVIQGVDFQFEEAGPHPLLLLHEWPGETTLVCRVHPTPSGHSAQQCGSHFEGTEDFRGSDFPSCCG